MPVNLAGRDLAGAEVPCFLDLVVRQVLIEGQNVVIPRVMFDRVEPHG